MTKRLVELEESEALEELVDKCKKKIENVGAINESSGEYNPWKGENFDEFLDDFFEILKNDDKEFSWLKVGEGLYNELKDKKGGVVSTDYGIPGHIRGDIENGTLFLYLVNPNIDIKIAICKTVGERDKKGVKKYIFGISSKGDVLYKEIVGLKRMKNLIGLKGSDEDKNKGKNKRGYYTANHPNVILSAIDDYKDKDEKEYEDLKEAVKAFKKFTRTLKNDDKNRPKNDKNIKDEDLKSSVEKSKKIANLEAFPFRSSTPDFAIDEDNAEDRSVSCLVNSNSNMSMLSVRIIIWKILKYIVNLKGNVKPVLILRRLNRAWWPSIKNMLRKNFFGKDKNDSVREDKAINTAINNMIKKLHKGFFCAIGLKDQDNMLKISKNIYKNDANMYKEYRGEECKEEGYKEKENDRKSKKEAFSKLITDILTSRKR